MYIFKPRRGSRSAFKSGSKRTTVLSAGELMVLRNDTSGSTNRYDVYIGNGTDQVKNLKPALYGDTSEEDITITADSSTTVSSALNNVVTGKTLGALIGSLKKAISLNASSISSLNNDKLSKSGGTMTGALTTPSIELSTATPFIDFHYNNSNADYTSRIIEEASGRISVKTPNGFYIDNGSGNVDVLSSINGCMKKADFSLSGSTLNITL